MDLKARDLRSEARAPDDSTTSVAARRWAGSALLVGAVGLAIMAFFLYYYRVERLPVPLGWDTSKYVWRTTLAHEVGIAGLESAVPPPVHGDPQRPAFPVIASVLAGSEGATTFQIAAVLPAVSAAAIGLAAGAFVAATLRRRGWELAVIALSVGVSAFVARLVGPEAYQDNLFAAAVFIAGAIPMALAIDDRRALLPAILLFGAGGVIHWAFFAFMMAVLLLTAVVYAPASLRSWRSGEHRLLDTPAARVSAVVLGATAISATTIFAILGASTRTPHLSMSEFAKKLRLDIPKYRFLVTLPLGAVGVGSLLAEARRDEETGRRTRLVLTFLLAWCALTLTGYLAFVVLDLRVPAHRFLSYALAIPVLAIIGLLWVGRVLERRARILMVALLVAALGTAAYLSHVLWFANQTPMDPTKIKDASTAVTYFDAVDIGTERPLVFIVGSADGSYTALMGHMIRAAMPAERIDDVYLFIGSPEDYAARRPGRSPSGGRTELADRYFGYMEATYRDDPVVLLMRSFAGIHFASWVSAHPESVVAPSVAVVRGPLPATDLPEAPLPVGGLGSWRVALLAVASLGILGAIGLGWALLLLGKRLRPVELMAVAPAVGIAAVATGGLLIDRMGVRLVGAGAVATAVALTVIGWGTFGLQRLRGRPTPGH
jgi:hypothetical protein